MGHRQLTWHIGSVTLTEIAPEVDLQKDYICCRQVANGTAFTKNKEAFKRLLKGEIRAYKIYLEDEKEAVDSIVRATHQDEDFVRRTYYSPETSQGARYNPDPNFNGVVGDYQILLDWDYVPHGIELHEFYNISVKQSIIRAKGELCFSYVLHYIL